MQLGKSQKVLPLICSFAQYYSIGHTKCWARFTQRTIRNAACQVTETRKPSLGCNRIIHPWLGTCPAPSGTVQALMGPQAASSPEAGAVPMASHEVAGQLPAREPQGCGGKEAAADWANGPSLTQGLLPASLPTSPPGGRSQISGQQGSPQEVMPASKLDNKCPESTEREEINSAYRMRVTFPQLFQRKQASLWQPLLIPAALL